MEQKIKNFDRSVEQMMNEHEVAPPFGMWNRISADLEAMPVAATAPVVTSLIPKRAMMGIIASALIIGTAVITGYLVSSSNPAKTSIAPVANTQIETSVKPTTTSPVTQPTVGVKNDIVVQNRLLLKLRFIIMWHQIRCRLPYRLRKRLPLLLTNRYRQLTR